jgi:ATP-dependent protease ClpP protease subunit
MKPAFLYITDEISVESFAVFSAELRDIEQKGKTSMVVVELTSTGGFAEAAIAFYSRIKGCQIPIEIRVLGPCHSAAVLVLAAGDLRKMAKEAWVMVHEEQIDLEELGVMSVSALEKYTRQLRAMEDQWARLLEETTKVSASIWADFHKKETYISAVDCKAMGLIEEII